jgi:ferric-dicitrate binding protein FerR (iron transport regulator)
MKLTQLIYKKLSNILSEEDEKSFRKWFSESESNKELFFRLKDFKDNNISISELENFDTVTAWSSVMKQYESKRNSKPKYFNFIPVLKYAAIFIGLLGSFLWYQATSDSLQNNQILISDDSVMLKTSDNKIIEIDIEGERLVLDKRGKTIGKQNGSQISYENANAARELIYNEVIVPHGKKFRLILSDGTLVHMNSGSSIKYPTNFNAQMERKVFLKGEAYFEVTKNDNSPFLVATHDMLVKVLGTHFNVSSYTNSESYTVLAEGSVAVYGEKDQGQEPIVIMPGEKAAFVKNTLEVSSVQLEDYLGWREGILSFNNELFTDIVKKIERHYNVHIENNNKNLDSGRFKGIFKEETITDLLDTFKVSVGFEYHIENNEIKINDMN